MKSVANWVLGILVMALAVVCVWEYTIISGLRKDVKSKQLMMDAQSVRMRDLQQQIVDLNQQVRILTTPPALPADNAATARAEKEVQENHDNYMEGVKQRQQQ